eukprot:TRINITY_DN54614_c0_g1_i1.p1 TRINITY_DN54614_c0_g1~~TRINITY_DN54614_c0_g1_i1.p1  ORF type:complete len:515 (+),score=102.59 TRINITY_DN54614_c0_g1_i1:104-1546(+)
MTLQELDAKSNTPAQYCLSLTPLVEVFAEIGGLDAYLGPIKRDVQVLLNPENSKISRDLLCSPRILDVSIRQEWLSLAMDQLIAPEDGEGLVFEVTDWSTPLVGACQALGVSSEDGQLTTARPAKLQEVRMSSSSGEAAAGDGLRRQWLKAATESLLEPDHGLFILADDGQSLLPNPHSSVLVPDDKAQFALLGRLIGLALLHKEQLGKSFSKLNRALIIQLFGFQISDEDLLACWDPEQKKQIQKMREYVTSGGCIEDWCLDFSLTDAKLPDYMEHQARCDRPLKSGKVQELVTNENLEEYIQLKAQEKVRLWRSGIDCQLAAMASGLGVLLQPELLRKVVKAFYVEELLKLLGGAAELDDEALEDWKKHTHYSNGLTADSQLSKWFWSVMVSLSPEQRLQVLEFSTSNPSPPALGFSRLPGGLFSLEQLHGERSLFPTASTCFCILRLPHCRSEADLKSKLLTAVNESKGFSEAAVAE